MYRHLTGALIAGVLLLAPAASIAGQASNTVAVSTAVSQTCSIAAGTMAFSAGYDPFASSALNATGSLSYACTKGATSVTIGLDNGAHYANSTRNMIGASSSNLLAYALYQNSTYTTAWDNGTNLYSVPTPTSKASVTKSIYGTITAGQDVSVDSYSDTVNSYINF